MAMAFLSIIAFSTAGVSVTDSDTSVTLVTPEEDAEVDVGGFVGGDIPYEVDYSLDSAYGNDTNVSLLVQFEDEAGETYDVWHNGTQLSPGDSNTVEGELVPDGYEYPENLTDVSMTAEATFTDATDSTLTNTASDTNLFQIVVSTLFNEVIQIGILVAVLGVFMREF